MREWGRSIVKHRMTNITFPVSLAKASYTASLSSTQWGGVIPPWVGSVSFAALVTNTTERGLDKAL